MLIDLASKLARLASTSEMASRMASLESPTNFFLTSCCIFLASPASSPLANHPMKPPATVVIIAVISPAIGLSSPDIKTAAPIPPPIIDPVDAPCAFAAVLACLIAVAASAMLLAPSMVASDAFLLFSDMTESVAAMAPPTTSAAPAAAVPRAA